MGEVKDDSKILEIEVSGEPEPIDKPTLSSPTFALVENPFKVTGMTPEANQEVWIELDVDYGLDEKIASGISDSARKFEIEVQLTEIGFNKIHSEIETFGLNKTSPSKTVLTLNYVVVGGIALAVFLLLWRAGVFKGIGGVER